MQQLTIESITTVPLNAGATFPVSADGVELNNTALYQNGVTQPVVFCGSSFTFNVSVSLSPAPSPGGAYTLIGLLQTRYDGLVEICETTSVGVMPFSADVAFQIVPHDFLYLGPTIQWQLKNNTGQIIAQTTTPIEIYFIPKPPVANFQSGIPVELLRAFQNYIGNTWAIRPCGDTLTPTLAYTFCGGQQAPAVPVSPQEEIAMATLFCYQKGLRYNSLGQGKPGFYNGSTVRLLSWVNAESGAVCNCEDQTLMLWMILTTLFGREATTGYIGFAAGSPLRMVTIAQGLIGVEISSPQQPALVNNPMYGSALSPTNQAAWVVTGSPPPPQRVGFANHRFCVVTDANSVIADATIGPFLGLLQIQDYANLVLEGSQSAQLTIRSDVQYAQYATYAST